MEIDRDFVYSSRDEEEVEYPDLELDYLDSWVGDDYWHQKYERTGSIDLDPDWY